MAGEGAHADAIERGTQARLKQDATGLSWVGPWHHRLKTGTAAGLCISLLFITEE